jgi:predicted ATPase
LIRGYFNCESTGTHRLKGIEQEMQLYRVLGETGAQTRLAAAAATGLTPFVGRAAETERLRACWQDAQNGALRIALIRGDAGIGKSRLVLYAQERAAENPDAWVMELRCSPFHQNSALYPTIEYLQRARLRFEPTETADERLAKIEKLVDEYALDRAEAVPLLAALLSVPPSARYAPLNLTPQRQKEKTFELLRAVLLARAQRQPVLMVLEDLHWADPSTLALLDVLLQPSAPARLLLVLTFRPDFTPQWTPRPELQTFDLAGFPPGDGEKIIARVAAEAHRPLPRAAVDYILAKTDGIPLFLEELTATIVESEALVDRDGHLELAAPLETLAVPATLQDSLTARLDRQHEAKAVAQLGAVIGREFEYATLAALPGSHQNHLAEHLGQLVEAGILFQRGEPPHATYQFKHALIQDSAYATLVKSARRDYHRLIAQALEQSPQTAQAQPELIGHHYEAAGLAAQAIPFYQKAGQLAVERSANHEAIADLSKVLQLIEALPAGPERAGAELLAQTYLGLVYMMTGGYAHPDVARAYTRARDLCRQLGDPPQVFPVMHGLVKYHLVRAEYATGIDLAAQLLDIARASNDRALLVEALYVHGAGLFWTGHFVPACQELEQAIALYDPNEDRAHTTIYGADPSIVCHSHHCWALAIRGYPEQALAEAAQTVALAKQIGHPWSLGYILRCAALTAQICRDVELAAQYSGEEFALAVEQSFPFWKAGGSFTLGWARCQQGRFQEGIDKTLEGLAVWTAVGTELGVPLYRGHLAEHYGDAGMIDEGLATVADCFARIKQGGEHLYEAELHRIQGDLLLRQDPQATEPAERCYRQAIELAQIQGAKTWQLRAMMRLARLLQSQQRTAEARALLTGIYEQYTEGFATPDLVDARALLEALHG